MYYGAFCRLNVDANGTYEVINQSGACDEVVEGTSPYTLQQLVGVPALSTFGIAMLLSVLGVAGFRILRAQQVPRWGE
jgi:hypothetical protein